MRYSSESIQRAVPRTVSGIFFHANGNRLNLGNFNDAGLNYNDWNFDDDANDNLGVFALMMEKVM